jgi:Domain of unknown function (DUF222)/HNH endonuclease
LDQEAGEAVCSALLPLARPAGPADARSPGQRRADALADLARLGLQAGRLPQVGGLRPQVTVTVELASLVGHGLGGVGGWGGSLPGESVRRLCCDATLSRAIVHRHPNQAAATHPTTDAGAVRGGHVGNITTHASHATHFHNPTIAPRVGDAGHGTVGSGERWPGAGDRTSPAGRGDGDGGLAGRLHRAMTLLPPPLGAPTQLVDLGRATRLIAPALRRALTVRDGGCVADGCDRPAPWTDAHHLTHWLAGGATSLDNLVLLCRVHHRAVHDGGWQLHRDPGSGRLILTPPARHLIPAPAT